MTDETARPATAPENATPVPVVARPPAAGDASSSGPGAVSDPGTMPRTTMTDAVVARIAGIAAAAVPGVHHLGGALDLPPDAPTGVARPDGAVTVVVGEREAAVTVAVTVEFGARLEEVAAGVRREVSAVVERMTDLHVRDVDVRVADVHAPAGPPTG